MKNDTPLIASRIKRELSGLGYKQLNRIIEKAAKQNNTNRYDANFKPMKAQIVKLVGSLIFDHNISKEQLSVFQRQIKVVNGQLQLPSNH